MSWLEIFAVISGFISVWLFVRQNIWSWPAGIINVLLYVFIFFDSRLYLDMSLQVFYVFIQVYGWYKWLHPLPKPIVNGNSLYEIPPNPTTLAGHSDVIPTSYLSARERLIWLILGMLSTGILFVIMRKYTDDSMPFLDSLTTSISLIAQWFLTRKKIENWILWIIADAIYVPMYIYKSLPGTALLYLAFLILAVIGLKEWEKTKRISL